MVVELQEMAVLARSLHPSDQNPVPAFSFIGNNGSPVSLLKMNTKPDFGDLGYSVNSFSFVGYGYKVWRCRQIPVPDIVVNCLKMPDPLSCLSI